jgi:hypothetical protein
LPLEIRPLSDNQASAINHDREASRKMKRQMITSLVLALSAFSIVWLFAFVFSVAVIHHVDEILLVATLGMLSETPGRLVVLASCVLSIWWIFFFVKTLTKFKLRGLWQLTILPIALFWPVVYLGLILACSSSPDGCAI